MFSIKKLQELVFPIFNHLTVAGIMALKTKFINASGWQTVEYFWNTGGTGFFLLPPQASIRVRYGGSSWWNGYTGQQQKLPGNKWLKLSVGLASIVYARMQISVSQSQNIQYQIYPGDVSVSTPEIPI